MANIDTLEGAIDDRLWFHYDASNDVLYLRLLSHRDAPALSEETNDGLILLRDEVSDEPIGLTIVNWWARFGTGVFPDSIREIRQRMQPLASKLAA